MYLIELCIFLDFLVAGASNIQTIAKLMPSFHSLLVDSGIALPVAFQLVRPLLRAALQADENPNSPLIADCLKPWLVHLSLTSSFFHIYALLMIELCEN